MIKSRAVLAASAVFLSIALAAGCLAKQPDEPAVIKVKPTEVLTRDWEYPVYKPKTILIYCGDGGAYIDKINWIKWSKDGATGTGEYFRNLCEPSCSDGKMVHAPVHVHLSELTPRKGKFYLRTLEMTSLTGKDFPWRESGVFEWDVMEFAKWME